jgi:hypothetical protein
MNDVCYEIIVDSPKKYRGKYYLENCEGVVGLLEKILTHKNIGEKNSDWYIKFFKENDWLHVSTRPCHIVTIKMKDGQVLFDPRGCND